MSRFAAVLFDLDNTLCRHEQEPAALFRAAFDHAGIEPFGSPTELWAALDGPIDPDDELGYLADGFGRLAADHARDVDATALARGFVAEVDNTAVSLLPGAQAALVHARKRGAVGLVTNGPERRQSTKLDALDLHDAFDVVVYAGDMPRRKPHRDPFDRALDALDESPEQSLYVGDSLEYDVAGAQGAGLAAAWCPGEPTDPGDHRPDFTFETLHELSRVV
ncbi:HAD family hydrolase [Halorarius litoreus]|uniref:HAD family hydrolase n=1 Tax=Halorarius litoreus TaxID=2962676 RepID=UPI0020CF83E0|nr:HAD family hydrolase [Halorarius litoreus]